MFLFRKLIALILFLCILIGGVFVLAPARAQNVCSVIYQVIITLQDPLYGYPTVWDAVYKKENAMTHIYSGVPMDDGTIVATGRILSAENFDPQQTFLVNMNRRSRVLKEALFPARPGEKPVKIMKLGNRFIVAANIRGGERNSEQHVRITWYDLELNLIREIVEKSDRFDYTVNNLSLSANNDGFVATIAAYDRRNPSNHHGRLVAFTKTGEMIWQRSYRIGIPNMLYNLVPLDTDNYLAMGRIRMEDGRIAAWILKIGYDGAVLWQRTYPRGLFSVLKSATRPQDMANPDGVNFLLSGYSSPTDGGPDAGWIIALNALGKTLWQRYFRHMDYDLHTDWIATHKDERIMLGINAIVDEDDPDNTGKKYNHVRLVTLTANGILLNDESYVKASNAEATDFAYTQDGLWNGERIVFTTIERDTTAAEAEGQNSVMSHYLRAFKESMKKKEKPEKPGPVKPAKKTPKILQEGWSFVATALDPFDNPCVKPGANRYH